MSTVAESLKSTYENARGQVFELEKELNKRVAKLEKKAKETVEDVRGQFDDVPQQLKGAWETVVTRVRSALAFATREELEQLGTKVDELAKKVDKLIRGEKLRAATAKPVKKA
jgi:hypothetical protein